MRNRDEKIKKLVKVWAAKAENDLKTAKFLLAMDEPPFDIICFHAQQSAEKYLKAFLVNHQIYFPKTHMIEDLLELCKKVDSQIKKELEDTKILSDYAVELRYPSEIQEVSEEDAAEALNKAKKVKDLIEKRLKVNFR
jgi:HEPN domain-containing protein